MSAAPAPVRAQSATPLDRYQPPPIGDALFASPSVATGGHLAMDAGLVLSIANAPLVLRSRNAADQYTDLGALVAHQAVLHVMASAALFSRVKVDLDVPMTLSQEGSSPTVGGATVPSPSGFAMNDVRLGARLLAFEPGGYVPGAALAFSAFLPTGNPGAFTSTGSARFEPRLILGADYGRLVWSASIGRQLVDTSAGLIGSDVTFSAGVAARIDRFQFGPELFAHAVVDRPQSTVGSVTLSNRAGGGLEAMLGAKAMLGPVHAGAAGGLGFLRGAGTPDVRFVFHVSIRPFEQKAAPTPTRPPDGDAAKDGADGAQKSAAGADGGTAPIPTVKVPVIPVEPPDTGSEDAHAPPPDGDGDGLADADDACPKEAGPKTEDPKTTGCPAVVRVEGAQIVILQQVHFETAKAVILSESFPVLRQIVDVMTAHPELARVAVDGHTDDRGVESSNLELSRARAASVMRWLVENGVDPRRLEARGFGPRRPIADNKTEEGRAKNRRVELQIRKRTDKGEAGWVDGPVD